MRPAPEALNVIGQPKLGWESSAHCIERGPALDPHREKLPEDRTAEVEVSVGRAVGGLYGRHGGLPGGRAAKKSK